MSPANFSLFAEKKRALGLSSASKAVAGLAALLPAVASATPLSAVYTPDAPLSAENGVAWDPYSNVGGNDITNASYSIGLSTCSGIPLIFGFQACGANGNGLSAAWAVVGSDLTQFSPGATIDANTAFLTGMHFVNPFALEDGGSTYFGYSLYDGTNVSYGWAEIDYTAADGFLLTHWGTTFAGAATIPVSAPVPEPGTYALVLGLVFAGVAVMNRWHRRRSVSPVV